jgi:hypothetical protein
MDKETLLAAFKEAGIDLDYHKIQKLSEIVQKQNLLKVDQSVNEAFLITDKYAIILK